MSFPDGSVCFVPPYAALEVADALWKRFGQRGAITAAVLIEEALRAPKQVGAMTLTLDQSQADAVCSVLDSAQHLHDLIRPTGTVAPSG